MMDKVSVARDAQGLTRALNTVRQLKEGYGRIGLQDHDQNFNTELMEALELGFLLDCAETVVAGALARQESRGGHYRDDFPSRDDPNWLKHTLAYLAPEGVELRYKPVKITKFEPKERVY